MTEQTPAELIDIARDLISQLEDGHPFDNQHAIGIWCAAAQVCMEGMIRCLS